MIKKIFKTFIIFNICIAITIPSNAAVSVSDGSAFVSKAEFAADLNNLSNRMAQLENSLDAKIDSLVSSYLTRNGIWNGAKQNMVNPTGVSIRYGFTRGTSYTASVTVNICQPEPLFYHNRAGNYVIATTPANGTTDLIQTVDKSGLLVLNTSLSNHQMGDNRCYCMSVNRSVGRFASDHFRFIYNINLIFKVAGTEASRLSASFISGAAGIYLDVPPIETGSIAFFVEKGDKVQVTTDTTLMTDAGTDYACTIAWMSSGGVATYDYNFLNATVY